MKIKNIVTKTDSYKMTHHKMYPKGTKVVYSYFEARKGAEFDKTTWVGLQALLKENMLGEVVTTELIDKAEKLAAAHFGDSTVFNRARWDYIVEKHNGRLPLEIMAVPEGLQIPIDNVLMTVANTDPDNCYWLTNHIETLLTHVWGPSTVASLSRKTKELFKTYLNDTCDEGENFVGLAFMLHDFGTRGVSSMEGAAHLGTGHLVNFMGTDTVVAIQNILDNYNGTIEDMPAFSINATEHSIMTAEGREGEEAVIGRLLDTYPTGILSVVSDSYDIYNCVENIFGCKYREQILARQGKLVVRPDSGDPVSVVAGQLMGATNYEKFAEITDEKILKDLVGEEIIDIVREETPHGECGDTEHTILIKWNNAYYNATVDNIDWNRHDKQYYYIDMYDAPNVILEKIEVTAEQKGLLNILWEKFGGHINNKGYKVLNPKVGLIWGDGIDYNGIALILNAVKTIGFSVENLVFGQGGGLLQKINRDTQRFAFKCSARLDKNGIWQDIYKDPIDKSKASKRGRLKLIKTEDGYKTVRLEEPGENVMELVYLNGELMKDYTFAEVRANSIK